MKYINITVKGNSVDNLFGRVPDEAWEKYQNGEITLDTLYRTYFEGYERTNIDYELTDITYAEED